MNMDVTNRQTRPPAVPGSESEMLDEVYRRLVQIHYANAEATNDDREIRRWTLHELMALIREVGVFRREQREASNAAS